MVSMMKHKSGLSIEHWQIDRVLPYAKNARLHSDQQIEFLAESMKEFGFVNPCLTDQDGMLIAGHGRVLAAKRLGMKTVPVIRLGHLTESQANRLRIADNRIHDLSTWDEGLLREVLTMIKDEGLPLPPLGFDLPSFEEFLAAPNAGQSDPETAPEPKKNPAVRPGDLWVLGSHRLLCGDSTKAEDVTRVIDKARPNLMVTDPPYGVEYDPTWRADRGVNKNKSKMGKVANDDIADWSATYKLFPGDVAYAWSAGLRSKEAVEGLEKAGFIPVSQIIWAKDRFTLGRGDYHFQHEPCWYAVRKGKNHSWIGGRSQSTLWTIPARDDSGHGHGTQKPIACMQRPIENNSRKGESIYEPFSGSGTPIIACEITGRKAIAIEIDPAYVQVAIERWEKFTGNKATLDGKTLEEIAKARAKGQPKGRTDAKSRSRKPVRSKGTVAAQPDPALG